MLLAQLLTAIEDPHNEGIAVAHVTKIDRGVGVEIQLPSGDRYTVIVQWEGDREATADDE
jgi:hypothetical protein